MPVVLALDRNARNLELLASLLKREGYETVAATGLEELDQALAHPPADLTIALLDITRFGREVWSRCERLREMSIPFLVVAPVRTAAIERDSLLRGARSVLVKPLRAAEFVETIRCLQARPS